MFLQVISSASNLTEIYSAYLQFEQLCSEIQRVECCKESKVHAYISKVIHSIKNISIFYLKST